MAHEKSPGTVLAVDDQGQVLKVLRLMLEHKGFSVLTASDGIEAVELYRAHVDEIVCVLLDLMMPCMGGEETFAELRRVREDVPVILMSGYSDADQDKRISNLGCAGFLKKPCRSHALLEKIRSVLDPEEESHLPVPKFPEMSSSAGQVDASFHGWNSTEPFGCGRSDGGVL
jgi:two-component system, cell cycle sensor histidine kinase and response regulator CckA